MVDSGTLVSYFFFGPFGLLLSYLKFGFPPAPSSSNAALMLYMASGIGSVLWATAGAALLSLAN